MKMLLLNLVLFSTLMPYVDTFDGNSLKYTEKYGLKDSLKIKYYKNGKTKARIVDSCGITHITEYDLNGCISRQYSKHRGKLQGQHITYLHKDSCKTLTKTISNYSSNFKNGHYLVVTMQDSANNSYSIKCKGTYIDGKLFGPYFEKIGNSQYFLSYYHKNDLFIQYFYEIKENGKSYYDYTYLKKKIIKYNLKYEEIKSDLDSLMYLMPVSYIDFK